MKSGTCPKCSAQEVYRHLPKGSNPSGAIALNDAIFTKAAIPEKYLCLACGYLEYYLPLDETVRATVEENWQRVS